MNKKEHKAKEPNDKAKAEEAKTERSIEKNINNNKEKENNNNNNNNNVKNKMEKEAESPGVIDNQQNKANNPKKEKQDFKNLGKQSNQNSQKNAFQKTEASKNPSQENLITEQDQNNANNFIDYLDDSGLPEAFQLIFAELITKKINPQNYYNYVGMRLRQIGKEINDLKNK